MNFNWKLALWSFAIGMVFAAGIWLISLSDASFGIGVAIAYFKYRIDEG